MGGKKRSTSPFLANRCTETDLLANGTCLEENFDRKELNRNRYFIDTGLILGTGVSIRNVGAALFPLASLAVERLKYSHMYTTMGLLGVFLAARGGSLPAIRVLPVIVITITTTGLYMLNDVFDIEIDKVSHPERALPRGLVSAGQTTVAAVLLMCVGTILAFSFSITSGGLVALIMLFGVLYSAPPVRLRRFPVLPSAIIGFFVFLSFLAGASFWQGAITGKLVFGALLLWAMFLCASTAKDLGDIQGDNVDGVKSLPLILGFEGAFRVTAAVVSTAFLFPALFLLLFDLSLAFLAPIVLFFLLEIHCLMKMYQTRLTPEMHMWWERGFGPFVGVQISLMLAALL